MKSAKLRSIATKPARGETYVAGRWRGEIRVTQRPHYSRSLACREAFGADAFCSFFFQMETAPVGGPGRIAANNKLEWKGFPR